MHSAVLPTRGSHEKHRCYFSLGRDDGVGRRPQLGRLVLMEVGPGFDFGRGASIVALAARLWAGVTFWSVRGKQVLHVVTRLLWVLVLVAAPLTGCRGDEGPASAGGDGGAGGRGGAGGAGGAGQCADDEDCDDADPCTDDVCGETGTCESPPSADGTACPDGTCVVGLCEPVESAFPCTEQGLLDAVAQGGGPYGFSCDGPQTVTTSMELILAADVILDGLGKLMVDGGGQHRLFSVRDGATVELRRLALTGGLASEGNGGAIVSSGTLTIAESTVSGNVASISGGGIANFGEMTIANSAISGNNSAVDGGGVLNTGMLMVVRSTISDNTTAAGNNGGGLMNTGSATVTSSTISGNDAAGDGGGITNSNVLMLVNSTVSGNDAAGTGGGILNNSVITTITSCTIAENTATFGGGIGNGGVVMMISNTLLAGSCSGTPLNSAGYNAESAGDTCGFDEPTDLVDVSSSSLALGPLSDNGGPTMTHALLPGSVAIDTIPALICEVAEDQRGEPRPETGGTMCDVGAFEVQP